MFFYVFERYFIRDFILEELDGCAKFRELFNLKFTFEHKKHKICFVALLEKHFILFEYFDFRIKDQMLYTLLS